MQTSRILTAALARPGKATPQTSPRQDVVAGTTGTATLLALRDAALARA